MPAAANSITQIAWTAAALPGGIGSESMFYGAAGGPKGFVIVGDTGASGFRGLALTSADGQTWELVDDDDIAPWSLEKVIATDRGDWTPFPGPSGGDLPTLLALHGPIVVAAGITVREDGPLLGIWVGAVTYAR